MSAEAEVAALRLMLREVAQTDATGIDYALRCQRERDEARAAYAAAQRELHRLSCGEAIESDGLCPEGIRAEGHRAWSRLWHREARRLWREVQDHALLSEEHLSEVMRLRSVIRRYLRTNPPQVEALRDLLVRSANGESIDAGLATTRAAALREAADIARAHGGISAYYAIRKLAAEVEEPTP